MKLLTTSLREKLLANGRANRDADGLPRENGYIDHKPVVKLFTPDAGCTWLLTEIDPDDLDRAFGLCDLGFGCPELGYVSLSELASVRGKLGLPDRARDSFHANHDAIRLRRRGAGAWRYQSVRGCFMTNITPEHRAAFEALASGDYDNFALFSCFVNGEPAAAIVAINRDGDNYDITPLFVSVTPALQLTDHDGQPAEEPPS